MASIEEIRNRAAHIPNAEMRDVCFSIIEGVANRLHAESRGMWTYQTFSKWSGREACDDLLQSCVQLLVTREDARLLDMHFLFFDPQDPNSVGDPIDDQEVADAYQSGYLIHPDSGEAIPDFEENLVPYFVLNGGLVKR